jgi:hypothetical protein
MDAGWPDAKEQLHVGFSRRLALNESVQPYEGQVLALEWGELGLVGQLCLFTSRGRDSTGIASEDATNSSCATGYPKLPKAGKADPPSDAVLAKFAFGADLVSCRPVVRGRRAPTRRAPQTTFPDSRRDGCIGGHWTTSSVTPQGATCRRPSGRPPKSCLRRRGADALLWLILGAG